MTLDNLKYALFLNNRELLNIINALEDSLTAAIDAGFGDTDTSLGGLQSLIDKLRQDVDAINNTTIVGINNDLSSIHQELGTINQSITDINSDIDIIYQDIIDVNTEVDANNTAINQALVSAVSNINANITAMQTAIDNQIALINESITAIKADASAHYNNAIIHVTQDDKTLWNSILASANAYTQSLFNGVTNFAVNIVESLPENPSSMVIYFIAAANGSQEDYYDEYMFINDKWELIGSTYVNLEPYVLKTTLDTMLLDYMTINSFNNSIANYSTAEEIDTKLAAYTNTENLALNYATKELLNTKLSDYTDTQLLILNYATKELLNTKIQEVKTDIQDINNNLANYTNTENLALTYVTKQLLQDTIIKYTDTETLILNYATREQVNTFLESYTTTEDLILNYISNSELAEALLDFMTKTNFNTIISDYIKRVDVEAILQDYTSTVVLSQQYALKTDLHSHSNKAVIDDLSVDQDGQLLYQNKEIATSNITISPDANNALTKTETGFFVADKSQDISEIDTKMTSITDNQDRINIELTRFFTTYVAGSASDLQNTEDSPVGHIISFMGTRIPSHYIACDGTVYNILEYQFLTNHFFSNFGSINYFGGDGITTFAVPDLSSDKSNIIYCIKYEPTYFIRVQPDPLDIDIDLEIMNTLEELKEGLGINKITNEVLEKLNSNEEVVVEQELEAVIADTLEILNSGKQQDIDTELQAAISEAIEVLNQ